MLYAIGMPSVPPLPPSCRLLGRGRLHCICATAPNTGWLAKVVYCACFMFEAIWPGNVLIMIGNERDGGMPIRERYVLYRMQRTYRVFLGISICWPRALVHADTCAYVGRVGDTLT